MRELVSITTPTYCRSRGIIERTIKSVLSQTYSDWEWIIVGDGCSNEYVELLNDLIRPDKRIMFTNLPTVEVEKHYQEVAKGERPRNLAGAYARNQSLRLASGTYTVCLDDDDELLPNCIDLQIAQLYSGFDFVHGQVMYNGNSKALRGVAKGPLGRMIYHSTVAHHRRYNAILYPTSTSLRTLKHFPRPLMTNLADKLRWDAMIEAGARVGFIEAPLCKYHRVPKVIR